MWGLTISTVLSGDAGRGLCSLIWIECCCSAGCPNSPASIRSRLTSAWSAGPTLSLTLPSGHRCGMHPFGNLFHIFPSQSGSAERHQAACPGPCTRMVVRRVPTPSSVPDAELSLATPFACVWHWLRGRCAGAQGQLCAPLRRGGAASADPCCPAGPERSARCPAAATATWPQKLRSISRICCCTLLGQSVIPLWSRHLAPEAEGCAWSLLLCLAGAATDLTMERVIQWGPFGSHTWLALYLQ